MDTSKATRVKTPFVQVPVSVLFDKALKHCDIRVYAALRSYRNEAAHSTVYPSKATLAKRLTCSVDTISRSIKRLVETKHIKYKRGFRGHPNVYQFPDEDSRTNAGIYGAIEQVPYCTNADVYTATEHIQPEQGNHNKQPYPHGLFHGNEKSYLTSDGSIKIINFDGQHLDYGGGDDGRFRFGNLHGIEALKAARAHYAKRK